MGYKRLPWFVLLLLFLFLSLYLLTVKNRFSFASNTSDFPLKLSPKGSVTVDLNRFFIDAEDYVNIIKYFDRFSLQLVFQGSKDQDLSVEIQGVKRTLGDGGRIDNISVVSKGDFETVQHLPVKITNQSTREIILSNLVVVKRPRNSMFYLFLVGYLGLLVIWGILKTGHPHSRAPAGDKGKKLRAWGFVGLAILAIGLRLYFYKGSLWEDELVQIGIAESEPEYIFYSLDRNMTAPPADYLLTHYVLKFSHNEMVLHFPALIFGLLSLISAYHIGKFLLNRRAGIVTCLFLTFAYLPVHYSLETRMYSMVLFAFLTSTLFLMRALRNNSARNWVLYVFFSVLLIYSHYFSLFLFLPHIPLVFCRVDPRFAQRVGSASEAIRRSPFGVVHFFFADWAVLCRVDSSLVDED